MQTRSRAPALLVSLLPMELISASKTRRDRYRSILIVWNHFIPPFLVQNPLDLCPDPNLCKALQKCGREQTGHSQAMQVTKILMLFQFASILSQFSPFLFARASSAVTVWWVGLRTNFWTSVWFVQTNAEMCSLLHVDISPSALGALPG